MIKFLKNIFATPNNRVIINGLLLMAAILGNMFFQVFCIPSNWALIVIGICFINVIFSPISTPEKSIRLVVSFINGVSLCLFIYCVIFLEGMNLLGIIAILFLGIGLLTYIPHFFIFQILRQELRSSSSKLSIFVFGLGILTCLSLPIISNHLFESALKDFDEFVQSDYAELNQSFMTEKILGMGLIYHVEFCIYDGWRPPIHEPLLNVGYWLNGKTDPLTGIPLEQRLELYKKFFPEKKVKFDCSCAIEYSDVYHGDKLWGK